MLLVTSAYVMIHSLVPIVLCVCVSIIQCVVVKAPVSL